MIYIKRILWLLGHPILWLLFPIVFVLVFVFMIFEYAFLYVKNGDIQSCFDCFEIPFKIVDWYDAVEPKENKL